MCLNVLGQHVSALTESSSGPSKKTVRLCFLEGLEDDSIRIETCCPSTFFFTLDAGLLARSQYSEGPATGHLDTGLSWFRVSISKC